MIETGRIIQKHRQQAGFTQKSLAEALHVTDKAISKWERGICLPEVTLLPKLSLLLDVDLELLLSKSIEKDDWVGLIVIDDCDFSQKVFDKPLVYYLLSHYLLLGLTRIHVLTSRENESYLQNDLFKTLGFSFSFDAPSDKNTMLITRPWFLFGSDLTQQFQGAMLSGRNVRLVPENQDPVFYFTHDANLFFKDKLHLRSSTPRTLGRGMVCLDMSTPEIVLEVASFIKTYQNNSGLLIGSLEEIAFNKGIISRDQLLKLADHVTYGESLRKIRSKPQVD